MMRVGLTGSIAMGKSTVADMFRRLGAPVHDSDASAHKVYAPGGAAVEPVRAIAPEAVSEAGVDRTILKRLTMEDSDFLKRLEAVVHPIIAAERAAFDAAAEASGAPYALYDVPLLFETGMNALVDVVLVVSAPLEIQRARALAREGMTDDVLDMILERQTPDAEKRAGAHYVIDTDRPLEQTAAQVDAIHRELLVRAQKKAP